MTGTTDFVDEPSLQVAPWEDGQHVPLRTTTFEWWYLDNLLDDGSICVLAFYTKWPVEDTSAEAIPTMEILIVRPDGSRLNSVEKFSPDDYSGSTDSCDLKIGPNWLRGDLKRFEMHAEGNDLVVDLTMTASVASFRPGPPIPPEIAAQQGLGWLCAVPAGTVTGTLTYDGRSHAVSGNCYHDHNWGVSSTEPSIMDRWYWGRGTVGDYSYVYTGMFVRYGGADPAVAVLLLARGDEPLVAGVTPLHIITSGEHAASNGNTYPDEIEIDWSGGGNVMHLALANPKPVREVGNYLSFTADAELTVTWDGETSSDRARVMWEIQHLA